MTSISSLLGNMPSLVNYLNGNGNTATPAASTGSIPSLVDYLNANDGGGDIVSLSPQAQQLLAAQQSGAVSEEDSTAAKNGAIGFIADFFENNGIDISKMSAESKQLLTGLNDLIDKMSNASRDATFDSMTKGYVRGQRESFTLTGDGQRFTATVQYDAGKPVGLTITTVQGGYSSSAAITLGMDDAGAASTIEVARTERQYSAGGRVTSSVALDPMSLELYA